jgi:hypothetical protein
VRKSRNLLAVCFIAFNFLFLVAPAYGEEITSEVTTIVTPGGDDVSYQIPLTVSVVYDGVTYENVYATTNSVITFGRPDGTYWTYPTTPSVSIESKDWWVLPQQMPDTHFIINVSEGGFQVDGNYRPYGTFTGDTTSIIITAQIQTDGTVAYSYAVDGPLAGNERTGAVLTDGTVVPLSEVNIIEVEEAPVLEPEPVAPEPEPTPEPTPEPEPEPQPEPQPEPVQPPIIYIPPVEPPAPEPPAEEPPAEEPPAVEPPAEEPPVEEPPAEEPPAPEEEPPAPVEEPPTEAEPAPEEAPEPPAEEEQEVVQAEDVEASELPADTPIELENGVILTAGVVAALELFDNPAELLSEVFTNPAQVLTALSNIGADMSEEERKESTETILAAVIVGQIATQSAVAAAASAAAASTTYRRKP